MLIWCVSQKETCAFSEGLPHHCTGARVRMGARGRKCRRGVAPAAEEGYRRPPAGQDVPEQRQPTDWLPRPACRGGRGQTLKGGAQSRQRAASPRLWSGEGGRMRRGTALCSFFAQVQYAVLIQFSCGNVLWDRPILSVFSRFAGLAGTSRPKTTHYAPARNCWQLY